ncbi:uncharacterized protein LOC117783266 [Drosophila innubila]|uniref:uncharacterized protein LOC117783266 n=1 Tax=Drosophila innubila TaxID=198719 RepID=UPI00148DF155|nr:uncharacterized protein LOC117783266 [Drosophila innubila]
MILDLVLRTGAVVAVIIATKRLDIWDSSDESIKLYNESRDRAKPYAQQVCQYLNIYVPQLPPEREKTYLGIYYYNQTVMTIFSFLSMCPTYVSMVLDIVPGFVSEYGKRAREAYDEYQKHRIIEKEKKARKIMIDDKTLVMPLEPRPDPDPDCKCEKPNEKSTEGLVPKNAPNSPYNDNYCAKDSVQGEVKKSMPERKCKCPKCDRRQAEGWLDNKTRCPKRNPCEKDFNETPRKCDYKRTRIIHAKGSDTQSNKKCLQSKGILNNEPSKDFHPHQCKNEI